MVLEVSSNSEVSWAPIHRKSYDESSSILKSRDITLPTKIHISQSYGFSSSHVRMWQLDHKEDWASKNWRSWTVVLEKTLLESSRLFLSLVPWTARPSDWTTTTAHRESRITRRSWRCKGGLRLALLLLSCFSSVQFSRSVVSDSLWPHESQHPRPPCPSPTPGVYSNSCPSSRWCLPTISSSVTPFSSCPQSLPASGSFPMSQLFIHMGKKTPSTLNLSFWSVNEQQWQRLLGEGLPAA